MAYKRKGINRLRDQQEEESHTLQALAARLPLNQLSPAVRDGCIAAAEEFGIDVLNLATVFMQYQLKHECGHDETHPPDFDRPGTAVYRADCGGKEWVGQGALVK